MACARSSFSYFSWHNSKIHLREGDEVVEGCAVNHEMGVDRKTGRAKAIQVDLV